MPRSAWKLPFVSTDINKQSYYKSFIRTWSRNSCIVPAFIGKTFDVYNGKSFIRFKITGLMVGHKLGEFSFTRKICKHNK